jgi:hypothetical protein
VIAGFLLLILNSAAEPVSAQVYWKKDYIVDDTGRVIATATPAPADQIAPGSPSGLTHSVLTLTSVQFQWSPSTDGGGSGLAGYKVYRGNIPVAAVSGTTFTDNDLLPSTAYSYSVVAFDHAGNHSASSNVISFTTAYAPVPPGNLSAASISPSQINLTWTDNSTNESGFKIERRLAGGSRTQVATVGANTAAYSNSGLSPGTAYYYRVRAYGIGGDSPYSNEAAATTGSAQPTSLSISPATLHRGECYTATVGNGAGMVLDIQYTLNGGPPQQIDGWPSLNANGQITVCTDAQTVLGTYSVTAVRNTLNADWVAVSASVTVFPPQPASLSITPAGVSQGQCYWITAGNGAGMTLDVRYKFNGGPEQQINAWPALDANGQAYICTDVQTVPGTYTFVAVRNTLNSAWLGTNTPITVFAP